MCKKLLIFMVVLAIAGVGFAVSDDFSTYSEGDDPVALLTGAAALWDSFGTYSASVSTSYASGSYSANGMQSIERPQWDAKINASTNVLTVDVNIVELPSDGMVSIQMREDDGEL